MSSELQRSRCLEEIHANTYHANPNLVTSGRYLKTLRHTQSQLQTEEEKLKYEYMISRGLQKHIVYLQEAIISSYGNTAPKKQISKSSAQKIKILATSNLATNMERYSMVDVDGLRRLSTIKKAVVLDKNLVLPCKVRSENKQYKFNTEIIVTKNNVLTYASHDFDHDSSLTNINHYVLITKLGNGILSSPLVQKIHNKQAIR